MTKELVRPGLSLLVAVKKEDKAVRIYMQQTAPRHLFFKPSKAEKRIRKFAY